jgi:hypothetical protein
VVEFRNTPARSAIGERDSAELLEDLCIALRDVAVREGSLPRSEDAKTAVRLAADIAAELDARGVTTSERLDRLSQETGWLMHQLLEDCRRFPSVLPRVRELDGIRRYIRCRYCKAAERPEDDVRWGTCDTCLRRIIESLDSLNVIEGTVLFRTYNSEWRCEHADANTVLLAANFYAEGFLGPGACRRCLDEEVAKREAKGERAR